MLSRFKKLDKFHTDIYEKGDYNAIDDLVS